jgi:alkylation response protein AidB-like acyl-CoA dehydrogenase
MEFSFSEEQKSLLGIMKEFCEREVDRRALDKLADQPLPANASREDIMARVPWDLVSKAHDVGLRQLCVPKEYGGGGYGIVGGWVSVTALSEAAGYYGGQMGRLFTIPWKHCSILALGRKEAQDVFFPAFMSNRKTLFAASITEPDHGTDLLLPYDEPGVSGKCFASREGDEWLINGEKMFCTAGGCSDYFILSVRTDKAGPISQSMTSFLIPISSSGVKIARVNDMMGNEIPANTQFFFDNCRIPDKLRISAVNGAGKASASNLAGKNIHYMAFLGESRKTWEDIRDYAKSRVQGGKPIIQHPNVGMLVAEGDMLLQTARLLMYQFAWECDQLRQGELVKPLGWWYTNYWTKRVIMRLMEIGNEVYGGMAPQKELPFERWVRVNWSLLHGGSTGPMNLIKASHVL